MSFLHLASNANSSSSPTPPSYLHVSSGTGMSTIPSGLSSNSSSLFGSLNPGKQWTNIGQSSTTSSTSNTPNSLAQQLLMKQQTFLNNNGTNSLNSSSSSSHFESILGLTVGSASQGQMEKNVRRFFSVFDTYFHCFVFILTFLSILVRITTRRFSSITTSK